MWSLPCLNKAGCDNEKYIHVKIASTIMQNKQKMKMQNINKQTKWKKNGMMYMHNKYCIKNKTKQSMTIMNMESMSYLEGEFMSNCNLVSHQTFANCHMAGQVWPFYLRQECIVIRIFSLQSLDLGSYASLITFTKLPFFWFKKIHIENHLNPMSLTVHHKVIYFLFLWSINSFLLIEMSASQAANYELW